MKSATLVLAVCLSALIISSCSKKKQNLTEDDRIYIVADSLEFGQIHTSVDSAFEKVIYTPRPETLFYLIRIDPDKLENIKNSKNIIIAAPLNSSSRSSEIINSLLEPEFKTAVIKNQKSAFNKYDLWASDQLVMILTSPDIAGLINYISRNGNELFSHFQKLNDKSLFENLYNPRFENKKTESKFLKEYGWVINVQKDFELVLDKPQDNFVWLRSMPKNDLAKWIFIHWIDNASPAFLNPDSIARERNILTKRYLKPAGASNYVKITEEYKTSTDLNFHGSYAISTEGLWEMSDRSMGGPFINYTLYDEKSKRIYMLDGSIYAPNYMKKGLIRQLDVILQSFQTQDQLSSERKNDLLKVK